MITCWLAKIWFRYLIAPWKASRFLWHIRKATYSSLVLFVTSFILGRSWDTELVGTLIVNARVEDMRSWWSILCVFNTIWNLWTFARGIALQRRSQKDVVTFWGVTLWVEARDKSNLLDISLVFIRLMFAQNAVIFFSRTGVLMDGNRLGQRKFG